MIYKNIAGQKCLVYAWNAANGTPKTGDAGNITAYVSKDGSGAAPSDDVNPSELDATNLPGIYAFDLAQAETNCDLFLLAAKSTTADIQIEPVIAYTTAMTTTRAAYLDALISSRAAPEDEMALTDAAIDAILDEVVEGSLTMRQLVRLIAAAELGKTSGMAEKLPVFKAADGNTTRIEGVLDEDNNRTSVTLTP
jgi:hypothetical protein